MTVGAVGYPTYVYNTNAVSAKSLGKVGAIEDDALTSRIGYNEGAGQAENENPLRPGTSKNWMDILDSQMAMSKRNEARIMNQGVEW